MLDFKYQNPTKLIFGQDAHQDVGTLINPETARVLVVYGCGSALQNEIYDDVLHSLEENGVEYFELGEVTPNPRLSKVRQGMELCREKGVNFILAVGGGSVIDAAKAIAAGAKSEEDIWLYFSDSAKKITKAMPVGVVVTMPGSGSEVSNAAFIYNEEENIKRGVLSSAIVPKFAFLNPEITYSMLPQQIASGASEILGNLMQRYFTHTKNVDLSDRLLEAAMTSIMINGPQALKNPMDYNVRAEIMWAGAVAQNNMLGSGRVGDRAIQNIANEIEAAYDIMHGQALSIVTPAWMKYVYKANLSKFIQLAMRVFGVTWSFENKDGLVLEMVKRLETWYHDMELPARLREAEIGGDRLAEMADRCLQGRETIGNIKKLAFDDINNILKIAL